MCLSQKIGEFRNTWKWKQRIWRVLTNHWRMLKFMGIHLIFMKWVIKTNYWILGLITGLNPYLKLFAGSLHVFYWEETKLGFRKAGNHVEHTWIVRQGSSQQGKILFSEIEKMAKDEYACNQSIHKYQSIYKHKSIHIYTAKLLISETLRLELYLFCLP